MAGRRQVLAGLLALGSVPAAGSSAALAQAGRPPQHHARLNPVTLLLPDQRPFSSLRLQVDLVMSTPELVAGARSQQPRIMAPVVAGSAELKLDANGNLTAPGVKWLKARILESARQVLGADHVQDVLIVTLIAK